LYQGQVFGPLEFSRRDLAAINIQRGRDHGLPDYNAVREAFGIPRVKTWEEINPNVAKTQKIDEVCYIFCNIKFHIIYFIV